MGGHGVPPDCAELTEFPGEAAVLFWISIIAGGHGKDKALKGVVGQLWLVFGTRDRVKQCFFFDARTKGGATEEYAC
jgi:hypothetical protein